MKANIDSSIFVSSGHGILTAPSLSAVKRWEKAGLELAFEAQSSTQSAARQARKLLRPLRGDLLRLLRDLVRTNTVAMPPHGNETPAQLILRDFLREKGLRPEV